MANVLILEPWHRGSHHNWFTGWASTSRHNLNVAEATELGWRKSLITAPTQFAAKIQDCHGEIDALVACTPIDLPAVFGLLDRSVKRPPTLLYMHESQIGYPPGPKGGRSFPGIVADWGSIMAADQIAVATNFHASLLRSRMPKFARGLIAGAGEPVLNALSDIHILPIGIEQAQFKALSKRGPIRILWNHRWAHDKGPAQFVHAMTSLSGEGLDFQIYALGEVERSGRRAFNRLKNQLSQRILLSGFQPPHEYRQALSLSDLAISTSQHEFFGLAAAEAIAAGARPVLPNRLAYPELVPANLSSQFLYQTPLEDFLRPLLSMSRDELHANRHLTTSHAASFSWSIVAPKYDAVIDKMIKDAG